VKLRDWIKRWFENRERRLVLGTAKMELIGAMTHGDYSRVKRLRQIIREIEDDLGD
jgi:hypothetical protein